jgi:hypothetical protein
VFSRLANKWDISAESLGGPARPDLFCQNLAAESASHFEVSRDCIGGDFGLRIKARSPEPQRSSGNA